MQSQLFETIVDQELQSLRAVSLSPLRAMECDRQHRIAVLYTSWLAESQCADEFLSRLVHYDRKEKAASDLNEIRSSEG